MIIPIGTDARLDRRPLANYGLILLNIAAYLILDFVGSPQVRATMIQVKSSLMLQAVQPRVFEFVTYQFLHHDVLHLLGNMLFLWVFGNSVNARMGHVTYVLLYLAGGVFAGLGFAWMNSNWLQGASGAVAGVTTAYLVLFPRANVSVIYWFFFIGRFELPSMILILFKIILWDNVISPRLYGPGEVAYSAHLAGYGFGFCSSLLLLWIRAVPRSHFDILSLWRRAYQRRSLAAVMRAPDAQVRARYGRMARPVEAVEVSSKPLESEQLGRTDSLKLEIGQALTRRDWSTAADLYEKLLEADPRQVLPRQQQLHVANQLMSLQRYVQAADAYEKFLRNYSTGPDVEQVHFLAGIIYARYLKQYEPAESHLVTAMKRLGDPKQLEQCRQWLSEIRANRQDD